jgi:endoglucanase
MTIRSRTPLKPLAAVAAAVVATAALAACAIVRTDAAADPHRTSGPAAAVVRVDQVGYSTGERKVAYAMGTAASLRDVRFAVVDTDGRTVASGRLGASTGAWNTRYSAVRPIDLSSVRTEGSYRIRLTGRTKAISPTFVVSSEQDMAAGILAKNIRFFQAQRDGRDVIPSVLGRKPSHLLDAQATVYATPRYGDGGEVMKDERLTHVGGPVDVEGGWFDAGDFLKFTGTTAYSTTALLVAARDSTVPGLAEEAQHGLAWLDKMWDPATGTLYTQVGIGNGNEHVRTDHDVWRLPEADDAMDVRPGDPDYTISHRPVFRANEPDAPIPPSLAGRVSAAFALAAQSADTDDEARSWLTKAAAVYEQADTDPSGATENATAVPAAFYPEDSWQDDLELAAAQLAVAARRLDDPRGDQWQEQAADWAREYIASDAKGTLEVADVSALGHAELIDLGDDVTPVVEKDLRRQLDDGKRLAAKDPFGSGVSSKDFDSVPHALGLVATARIYERAVGDDSYRAFATQQRAWVLGANPWGSAFVVGVGTVFPHCPEHQVDNLAGHGDVVGAVVNGPNAAGLLDELNTFPTMQPCSSDPGRPFSDFDGKGSRYLDDVGAWQTVEPAIDFTANAVLAFGLSVD